mmetsp:Transcript_62352/g.158531  ORF Transcript_62352/g.158531 Transcript_62352/m.158531 type:complete len:304 (-) Transcript_62352:694-1605(-)
MACLCDQTGASECKVPKLTPLFWIIKVLATTIGESGADALSQELNGLEWIFLLFFAIALLAQFLAPRYIPVIYWSNVVLVSVVGTLVTDLLTDTIGVTLWATTPVAALVLGAVFALWFRFEGTLAMHSIYTTRREAWYWLTVLATFILGTALGDLLMDAGALGFYPATILFGCLFVLVLVLDGVPRIMQLKWQMNPVLGFWAAYVLSRPFGASAGDFLSMECAEDFDPEFGCDEDMAGLDLGPGITSAIFGSVIIVLVMVLSVKRIDRMVPEDAQEVRNKVDGEVPEVQTIGVSPAPTTLARG